MQAELHRGVAITTQSSPFGDRYVVSYYPIHRAAGPETIAARHGIISNSFDTVAAAREAIDRELKECGIEVVPAHAPHLIPTSEDIRLSLTAEEVARIASTREGARRLTEVIGNLGLQVAEGMPLMAWTRHAIPGACLFARHGLDGKPEAGVLAVPDRLPEGCNREEYEGVMARSPFPVALVWVPA